MATAGGKDVDKEMDDVIFGKMKSNPPPVPVDSEYVLCELFVVARFSLILHLIDDPKVSGRVMMLRLRRKKTVTIREVDRIHRMYFH